MLRGLLVLLVVVVLLLLPLPLLKTVKLLVLLPFTLVLQGAVGRLLLSAPAAVWPPPPQMTHVPAQHPQALDPPGL